MRVLEPVCRIDSLPASLNHAWFHMHMVEPSSGTNISASKPCTYINMQPVYYLYTQIHDTWLDLGSAAASGFDPC